MKVNTYLEVKGKKKKKTVFEKHDFLSLTENSRNWLALPTLPTGPVYAFQLLDWKLHMEKQKPALGKDELILSILIKLSFQVPYEIFWNKFSFIFSISN